MPNEVKDTTTTVIEAAMDAARDIEKLAYALTADGRTRDGCSKAAAASQLNSIAAELREAIAKAEGQ